MPHSRLPHCVLYGQLRLGRRSVGGQGTRFKDHIKSILKKCNIPFSRLETLASKKLPGDIPVPLECHTLTMNTILLQLSDAVVDISILQCSANSRFLSSMPTLWQTMLITHWPPQPQQNPLSTLKRKSSLSVMGGLKRRRRSVRSIYNKILVEYFDFNLTHPMFIATQGHMLWIFQRVMVVEITLITLIIVVVDVFPLATNT